MLFFGFKNAHVRVKYSQQELCSLYVVNEYTSVSAVQFIVCSITQPEK